MIEERSVVIMGTLGINRRSNLKKKVPTLCKLLNFILHTCTMVLSICLSSVTTKIARSRYLDTRAVAKHYEPVGNGKKLSSLCLIVAMNDTNLSLFCPPHLLTTPTKALSTTLKHKINVQHSCIFSY